MDGGLTPPLSLSSRSKKGRKRGGGGPPRSEQEVPQHASSDRKGRPANRNLCNGSEDGHQEYPHFLGGNGALGQGKEGWQSFHDTSICDSIASSLDKEGGNRGDPGGEEAGVAGDVECFDVFEEWKECRADEDPASSERDGGQRDGKEADPRDDSWHEHSLPEYVRLGPSHRNKRVASIPAATSDNGLVCGEEEERDGQEQAAAAFPGAAGVSASPGETGGQIADSTGGLKSLESPGQVDDDGTNRSISSRHGNEASESANLSRLDSREITSPFFMSVDSRGEEDEEDEWETEEEWEEEEAGEVSTPAIERSGKQRSILPGVWHSKERSRDMPKVLSALVSQQRASRPDSTDEGSPLLRCAAGAHLAMSPSLRGPPASKPCAMDEECELLTPEDNGELEEFAYLDNITDEDREGMLDELSCPICLATLTEPLRLHCGHAFCRVCLHLSMRMSPDGRRCPMCRAVARPANRKGSMDASSASVDGIIVAKLNKLLPEGEYDRRRELARIRLEEVVGGGRSLVLPVYHMGRSELQPGSVMHLHLFENRYKALIRRVIAGNRLFVFSDGPPRQGSFATVTLVARCSLLAGGKADIICRGVEKVQIAEVWPDPEIPGLIVARCLSAMASLFVGVNENPDDGGGSMLPTTRSSAAPEIQELSSLISIEGWLSEGREGELIDLPVVGRAPSGRRLPLAIGDRVTMSLQEQKYRVVAQRLLSSPQLCMLSNETPEAGERAYVVLVLRCKFKSNGSAKIVARVIEDVLILQVRWENWAGRLYYARSRVCNEETRKTITAFRSALWAAGGTPPGIVDYLALEEKTTQKCTCCVS